MMLRFVLLVCLLTAMLPATGRSQSATPVRVMSFNIRYGTAEDGSNTWNRRKTLVAEAVTRFNPDILGVQEALRFQLDELSEMIPGYTEVGVGRDDGQEAGEYSAILVRSSRYLVDDGGTYWLSDTPEQPGSKHWGNRIPRICTWARIVDVKDSTLICVFNTHWDHESQQAREKSAQLILESIGHFTDVGEPVIVMGDFNAGETNSAFLALMADEHSALSDTYRRADPSDTAVGTFNGFKGTVTGDKIDAILVSPQWRVRSAAIDRFERGGRYPSDHFPVTAVLLPYMDPAPE